MEELKREVNWLDLPSHLEDVISDKLITYTTKDFIRFGAVCRSWRSIYTQNRHRSPRHQLPVLKLHTGSLSCSSSRSFYHLSRKQILNFPSQSHNEGFFFVGSAGHGGWLLYQLSTQVHLFNPFLSLNNNTIHLPSLKDYQGLYRPVLSANPATSNPNFVVLAYNIEHACKPPDCSIMFYKCGDNAWTSIPVDKDCVVHDIIYCRDQFYLMSSTGVFACDVSSLDPRIVKVAPPIDCSGFCRKKTMNYILESAAGELLGVTRIWELLTSDTVGFQVFKLDENALRWVETKSLGGRSLFVGANNSMSVLASEFPGSGCRPNCIYFTEEGWGVGEPTECVPLDMGIYNLEDGSIQPHFPVESLKFVVCAPAWIEPTLASSLN